MTVYGQPPMLPGGRVPPFSGGIESDGVVYLSGQLAVRDGRIEGRIGEQTKLVLDGIEHLLAEAGLTLGHVMKATVWLTHPKDFDAFNDAYATRFTAPYPARSCVVSQLVVPDARIEMEVIASRTAVRAG